MDIPWGARVLDPDDAVKRILIGDHKDAEHRNLKLDAVLVELIRNGEVAVIKLMDGRLAFKYLTTD